MMHGRARRPMQLFAFLGVATTNIVASNSLKAAGLDAGTL